MSGLSGFSARFERFERFGRVFWKSSNQSSKNNLEDHFGIDLEKGD